MKKMRFRKEDGSRYTEWEEKKLGDTVEVIMGQSPVGEEINKKGEGEYLIQGKADLRGENVYPDNYTTRVTKYCEAGDVIMSVRAPVGYVQKIGYRACIGRGVCAIRVRHGIVQDYIYELMKGKESSWKILEQGSTFTSVNSDTIRNIDTQVPCIEEQKKIAIFLTNIDKLITNTKDLLTNWQQYKKGMMQKIFSRKLRFKRDDGSEYPEWEEKKLGEIFEKVVEKNKLGQNNNVLTNSAEYGIVSQREYFEKDIAIEGKTHNYTIIKKNDFVYNPRKSINAPYGPFNRYGDNEDGIVSPLYTCLRLMHVAECYLKYIEVYFKSDCWYSYVEENGAQNGARHDRVGMTDGILRGIPVVVPCIEEQKKIADFLTSIDSEIENYTKTLEQLEQLKRGLMQRMFA